MFDEITIHPSQSRQEHHRGQRRPTRSIFFAFFLPNTQKPQKKDENEKSTKKEKLLPPKCLSRYQPSRDNVRQQIFRPRPLYSSGCLISMGRGSIERSFRQRKKDSDSKRHDDDLNEDDAPARLPSIGQHSPLVHPVVLHQGQRAFSGRSSAFSSAVLAPLDRYGTFNTVLQNNTPAVANHTAAPSAFDSVRS